MKTVTAKEFQLHQSQMMKDAAKGVVYQITYHGKPWVELRPSAKSNTRTAAGSPEAFRESLEISLYSKDLPSESDYKALRRQHLQDKYSK